VGGVVDTVRDRVGGGPGGSGYSTVYSGGSREEETSALYRDQEDDDDDLFGEYHGTGNRRSETTSAPVGGSKATTEPAKPSGGWDEDWKDF